jgi:DNA-binding NarL/FixJ family response regulator
MEFVDQVNDPDLTVRETEVARFVARGWRYKRIAAELGISEQTVQWHARNAAEKIGGRGAIKIRLRMFVESFQRAS